MFLGIVIWYMEVDALKSSWWAILEFTGVCYDIPPDLIMQLTTSCA